MDPSEPIYFLVADTTESEKVKFEDTTDSTSGSTGAGATGGGAGSNKRAKNKKRREAQQEFTHSWMVGALKGHTARVLDMNFSSNGKFLASCAEGMCRKKKHLAPYGGLYQRRCYPLFSFLSRILTLSLGAIVFPDKTRRTLTDRASIAD